MKKRLIFSLFLCLSYGQSYAQVGMYDQAVSVPVISMFDDSMSSAYLNVMASNYAARTKTALKLLSCIVHDALDKDQILCTTLLLQYALICLLMRCICRIRVGR